MSTSYICTSGESKNEYMSDKYRLNGDLKDPEMIWLK